MLQLKDIHDDQLNQTMQLLKAEFARRGWKAQIPYIGTAHCFVDRGDGRQLHIFSATPPTTSFSAAHMANDKFATHQVLSASGVHQLQTVLIAGGDDIADALALIEVCGSVVVKPIDGGHGRGITVNVSTEAALQSAIQVALSFNKSGDRVLAQEQYLHDKVFDLRILCIDYKYVAAILRVPARVYGDGEHTVRQLVEKENSSPQRGVAYYAPLATINMADVETFLGIGIDDVPQVNEEVRLLGVANYGAGGETIDVTDDIPEWMQIDAIAAARASQLPVAGVDFITSKAPFVSAGYDELDGVIIEINKCPALMIHDRPSSGISRNTVGTYVDYLASL